MMFIIHRTIIIQLAIGSVFQIWFVSALAYAFLIKGYDNNPYWKRIWGALGFRFCHET